MPNHSRDDLGLTAKGVLLGLVLAAAWVAACAGVAPEAAHLALPWPVAPLHARCLAALHGAAALTWWMALRQHHRASVRIPLAMAAGGGVVHLLQVLTRWPLLAPAGPVGWAWLLGQVGAVGLSLHLLLSDRELQAPAERLDRPLAACALLGLSIAAVVAFAPGWAARAWPWPLGSQVAVLYASALSGWSLALLMLARERRHAERRLVLCGLAAAGPLVACATAVHREAFHHPALAVVWAAAFLGLSAMAGQRLLAQRRRFRAGPKQA